MERRHIFILNPAAGKSDMTRDLTSQVHDLARQYGLEYEIHITRRKGHAVEIVDAIAGESGPICRFYALGGDGTLNEVISGAAGHKNAEVANYPCGTGNDFLKIFDTPAMFHSLENLIEGDPMPIDVIKFGAKYAINICSAGIDARVAHGMSFYKRIIPIGGTFPYNVSLLVNFFKKLSRYYEVEIDGERLDGEYTIIVAASGRYYGGGYYAVPEAEPDDGLLDFVLLKKISHLKLLTLIGKYQKGMHSTFGDLEVYRRGRRLTHKGRESEPINYDGEIAMASDAEISVFPEKLLFIVPKNCKLIRNRPDIGREPERFPEKVSK